MLYTLRELECKDVINLCDGKFLGHISDLELDGDCGKITAVFVSAQSGFWSAGREDLRICWDSIRCIGEDAVLVEYRVQECDCGGRKPKRRWI